MNSSEKKFYEDLEKYETRLRLAKSSIKNNQIIIDDLKNEIIKSSCY